MSNDIEQLRAQLTAMAPQFAAALPKHISPDRFCRVVMTAAQTNPSLLESDRRSLYAAAMRASQAGLLPDGREGAIVTFKGVCQFMPMVAGLMKLARNSGEISSWSVQAVYEGDGFDFSLGDDEHVSHRPNLGARGKLIAVYSIVTLKDGEKSREIMSADEVNAIRQRSRSAGSGPWVTDYAEMAKKTVIRRHIKRLPLSTDIDGAMVSDDDYPVAPAPQPDAPVQAETAAPKKVIRLKAVAEQAPPQSVEVDSDGVISDDDIPI